LLKGKDFLIKNKRRTSMLDWLNWNKLNKVNQFAKKLVNTLNNEWNLTKRSSTDRTLQKGLLKESKLDGTLQKGLPKENQFVKKIILIKITILKLKEINNKKIMS
jgi:hypothetical protein